MIIPNAPWELSSEVLKELRRAYPSLTAIIQKLEDLSSEMDKLGLLILDTAGSVAEKNFTAAAFARSKALFDGSISLGGVPVVVEN